MFIRKILFVFVFCFLFLGFTPSYANIDVTSWNQKTVFTKKGRAVEVCAKTKINGLPSKNHSYKQWGYIFDSKLKIKIIDAYVKGRSYTTSFTNNELSFDFANAYNNDAVEFCFRYEQLSEKINKFYRNEYVSIPTFTAGANATVQVQIPDDLEVVSLNSRFLKNRNKYYWKGKVPKDGFSEKFSLTFKKAKWQVTIKNTAIGPSSFDSLNIHLPRYFKGSNAKVSDYKIITNNSKEAKIKTSKKTIDITFNNLNNRMAQANVTATIESDIEGKYGWLDSFSPSSFLNIKSNNSYLLTDVLNKINRSNKKKVPEYVKIGEWVYNFIEYDKKFIGVDLTIAQILKGEKGICMHYAILYTELLKTAGIPAFAVSGLSYDEEESKFEKHSWVLMYYNGEWLSMDPTWGIFSGKLPISHIFVGVGTKKTVEFFVYNYEELDKVRMDIGEEVIFLE